MLISRLSKAQYVIFLGTTFQSHSTSSAIKRLGENQTFWITAIGWCQVPFLFNILSSLVSIYYHWYGVLHMWMTSLLADAVRCCIISSKAGAALESLPKLLQIGAEISADRFNLCSVNFYTANKESCWPLFLNSCTDSEPRTADTKQHS